VCGCHRGDRERESKSAVGGQRERAHACEAVRMTEREREREREREALTAGRHGHSRVFTAYHPPDRARGAAGRRIHTENDGGCTQLRRRQREAEAERQRDRERGGGRARGAGGRGGGETDFVRRTFRGGRGG